MSEVIIPAPQVAPFGIEIEKPESIHEVWDVFVKPMQSDDAPPQSVEDRMLMAVLRAVHEGMRRSTGQCAVCGGGGTE